jgi:hypothetical protein
VYSIRALTSTIEFRIFGRKEHKIFGTKSMLGRCRICITMADHVNEEHRNAE